MHAGVFFYDGEFVGTDTHDFSANVSVEWYGSEPVALLYILYRPDDIECCPTGGGATVRFPNSRSTASSAVARLDGWRSGSFCKDRWPSASSDAPDRQNASVGVP